jgi:putative hemolysin
MRLLFFTLRPLLFTLGLLVMNIVLALFSYMDRAYRELGRVTPGRFRSHLEAFETEIEPRLRMDRRRANLTFSLLARLWLALVAVLTARAVVLSVPGKWERVVESIFFIGAEVSIAMQLVPNFLLVKASARWVRPAIPVARFFAWVIRPLEWMLEMNISLLHLSDDVEPEEGGGPQEQEALEALVEAATEEGIIEQDEARLIEQVVEFHDKRVRDLMTPRPDIVSIPATATLDQLRRVLVETKHSRLPVYENSLDEIAGIVVGRDILGVPEREAGGRLVRELVRPALFVPETKLGSELLKEMQRKNQQLAIVIDEYGLVAGLVTVEDLVEEIVGEIGEEDRAPTPDIVRESPASIILRGSVPVSKLQELFGVELGHEHESAGAATLAGLLNSVSGHVPITGETIDYDGLRFEVLEANQRKVLRLRARHLGTQPVAARTV